ncbi:MAG: DNA internalization-related competence protein ComEC/Rec2 [Gammaproteobacteria bacterium]|nr:DNA internalization-related competence protein ComEC/Rec2 [Gammaproteobacteria bacterium]
MIGTVVGVFAVGWMPALTPLVYCACSIAGAVSLLCWQRSVSSWLLLGLALGFCYGNAWGYSLLARRLPAALEGQTVALQGAIIELPQWRRFSGGGQRQRFAFVLEEPACLDNTSACLAAGSKLLLSWYGPRMLEVGQRWRWQAKLKRPWGLANPGSFNYQAWLAQHRFSATGSVREHDLVQLADRPAWWLPHQRLRQYLSLQLPMATATAADEVLRALTLGDRSAISASHWRQLQGFGLNHLVVISGLHVGMVAALGFYLGLFLGRIHCLLRVGADSYKTAQLAAAGMALGYSALAGFALPTQRALVMLACVQLISLYRRRLSLWRSLQVALLVIALLDPLATHNAGFWLSFGAVALIAWLLSTWPQLRGLQRFLLLQLGLSLATGLAGSFWFGGSSWLAPLANLLAVPVVTVLVAPLCLLGGVVAPLSHAVASWCWSVAAWPVTGFFALANAMEQSGLDLWIEHQPGPLAVLLSLLAILVLLLPRGMRLRWLALPLLLPQFLPDHPPPAAGVMELTVFDVGQGLAVLVRTRDMAMLYDTGAGDPAGPNMASSVILPYLRRRGIRELELLVISHGDRDHASGVATLVQNLAITELWYGDQPFPLDQLRNPVQSPSQKACRAGQERRYAALRILQLHPEPGQQYDQSNNRSCVLLLEFGGYRVLLPGDIGKFIELNLRARWRERLAADLLLAPHHGSLSSSSTPFIRVVDPDSVVFSAGYQNRFHHPQPRVLARYRGAGIQGYETAKTGALTFVIEAGVLRSVTEYRQQHAYYWH